MIRFHRKQVPFISFGWDEGKFWDNWMIVHFWSGVTIGCALPFIAADQTFLFGVAFIGLVAWEAIEYFFDIHEVIENRVLDVVYGLIGMWVIATYVTPALSYGDRGWALVVSVVVLLLLGLSGWRAYQRRTGTQVARNLP